jgi:hypothetical protein
MVCGVEEHHPEGSYHLRYGLNGKQVWEPVGEADPIALRNSRIHDLNNPKDASTQRLVEAHSGLSRSWMRLIGGLRAHHDRALGSIGFCNRARHLALGWMKFVFYDDTVQRIRAYSCLKLPTLTVVSTVARVRIMPETSLSSTPPFRRPNSPTPELWWVRKIQSQGAKER